MVTMAALFEATTNLTVVPSVTQARFFHREAQNTRRGREPRYVERAREFHTRRVCFEC
jgi:hypothetical protein